MPEYWKQSWHCQLCNATIRRHHQARHRGSRAHQRLMQADEPTRSSDAGFTLFLAEVRPVHFSPAEKLIFYTNITAGV